MEQRTWTGVRAIVIAITALFLLHDSLRPNGDGSFQLAHSKKKAFHSNDDLKINGGIGNVAVTSTAR
jgi:hypothetical protein